MTFISTHNDIVYLIYDGECPICSNAAQVLKIRKAAGKLQIINARTEHPLVDKAKKDGYNLDNGIIVFYHGKSYYGKEAMNMLAMIGSPVGFFNKMNVILFRSKTISSILYPIFKFIRRCLLILLRVQRIKPDNTQPIFKSVFGNSWEALPIALQKRYATRPFCDDVVTLHGKMDIELSRTIKLMSPLLKLFKVLVPFEKQNIQVTVYCRSEPDNDLYILERYFHISDNEPYVLRSKFIKIEGSDIVELSKFGIGWRCNCIYEGNKVRLLHIGFVWKFLTILIPVPIALFLGKGYAEEEAIDDNTFRMRMTIIHPWFGKVFEYRGQFKVI